MTAAPSMAEVLGRHMPGDYTYLFDADPASTPPERTVRCRCGDRGGSTFAEHVAQALAAAGFGHVASVERERDALLALARHAISAHRDLHRIYGSTAVCGGGIGGAAMTQHCGVICGYNERHDGENAAWHRVERAYFRHQDGDPAWADDLRATLDGEATP